MTRYYRRRSVRVVKPKKRWASQLKGFQIGPLNVGTTTPVAGITTLVENSVETATPTPVIVKTGNFKVQGDCYISSTTQAALIEMMLYVIYLPQGVSPTSGETATALVESHPEWILSWKCIDMNTVGQQSVNGFSFSSRLKRNLNSGDQVAILAVGRAGTGATANISVYVHGNCQFWTTSA